jgi:hypothetical protein
VNKMATSYSAWISLPFVRENSFNRRSLAFMYRRPTLCTLHIAVDFLKSLKIAVVLGGGVLLGYSAYIISL